MQHPTLARALLAALAAGAFSMPCWARLSGFPDYVSLPPDVIAYDEGAIVREAFAEVEFPLAEGKTVAQRGRHVRSYTRWPNTNNKPSAATWAQWLPALRAGGWVLQGSDGATTYTLKRVAPNGQESWLRIALGDFQEPLVELIELAASQATLVLPAPAAQPETPGPQDDFPFLRKPDGAVLAGTGSVDEPLDVAVSGLDREAQLVGTRYVVKRYTPPASLSKLQFETIYRAALEKAGWKVKPPAGGKPGEGQVVAQYAAQGRLLWAVLGRGNDNSDSGLMFKLADLGAPDWGSAFDRQCRLPLYGVNFDFDKASLKPESLPVLAKARDLLKARAGVKAMVQGHTDNVGNDDYNQKLSAARADTVRQWLAANGIEATRLSSQGFGKTRPVADNASDAGRAKNRRVELVREGCR